MDDELMNEGESSYHPRHYNVTLGPHNPSFWTDTPGLSLGYDGTATVAATEELTEVLAEGLMTEALTEARPGTLLPTPPIYVQVREITVDMNHQRQPAQIFGHFDDTR